jgi:hypothetical protein
MDEAPMDPATFSEYPEGPPGCDTLIPTEFVVLSTYKMLSRTIVFAVVRIWCVEVMNVGWDCV